MRVIIELVPGHPNRYMVWRAEEKGGRRVNERMRTQTERTEDTIGGFMSRVGDLLDPDSEINKPQRS